MAKIYGNLITFGGGGGQNADLPPLLDNFKAVTGEEENTILVSAEKMEESRAEQLAGAVWVYGDHSPANVNDGTKIQLAREEVVSESPATSTFASSGTQTINDLPSRSKVKLGRYNGESVRWVLSRESVTNELCLVLDAYTSSKLGNFSYDVPEPSNPDNNRKQYGNNRLIYSNAQQWLNSGKPANEWYSNQHTYDAPPDYQNQDGFLYEWTSEELLCVKNSQWRTKKSNTDGGGFDEYIAKITLMSPTELGVQTDTGGNQLDIYNSQSDRALGFAYWTRGLEPTYSSNAGQVQGDGSYNGSYTASAKVQLIPICKIESNLTVSNDVDTDGCYTIIFGGDKVSKSIPWSKTKDFYARQFTYNSKKQYQTMLEGALASVIVEGAPAQVTDLVVSGSGGTATLTWVNPVDDPVYAETVVVQKVGSAPSDITDGTEIYRGTDQTCTATGLEQSTDYYFAVYTVSGIGVYKQPVVSDVYRYDFSAEPTEWSKIEQIQNGEKHGLYQKMDGLNLLD